jgi:hypothetical protein
VADILLAIKQQGQRFQEQTEMIAKTLQEELLKHRQEQARQNDAIRSELSEMKKDLKQVSGKCEDLNERCSKIESENNKIFDHVANMSQDVNALNDGLNVESDERKEEREKTCDLMYEMKEELERMSSEIDRLEEFSRRDNLRMFGIGSVIGNERENYDDCCAAVCNVLNHVDGLNREWTERDIVRAHRVGQARSGQPRPMIVKFSQWKDKMRLITDKPLRGKLEREGVRVANDLTRRQAGMVAEAKREGKAAYFVKGKMTIGPKRADPRSFSQVVEEVELGNSSAAVTNPQPEANSMSLPPPFHPQDYPSLTNRDASESRVGDSLSRRESEGTRPKVSDVGGSLSRRENEGAQPKVNNAGVFLSGRESEGARPKVSEGGGPLLRRESAGARPKTSGSGNSQSRAEKEGGSRFRTGVSSFGGSKQQPGITNFMRGQHNPGNRSNPASGAVGGRTLRSSTSAAK